jgi:hypothetical protein
VHPKRPIHQSDRQRFESAVGVAEYVGQLGDKRGRRLVGDKMPG